MILPNDISRCTGGECKVKENCARYQAFKQDKEPMWVSVFKQDKTGFCENYISGYDKKRIFRGVQEAT